MITLIRNFARPDYTFKEIVEKELDKLVSEGTLQQVQFSEWAAPIVLVLRETSIVFVFVGNSEELLILFIPQVEDLFAKLSGGCTFTSFTRNPFG